MLYTRYMVVCGHRVIIRGLVSRQTADMLVEVMDSSPDDPIGPCEVIEYVTSEPDDMDQASRAVMDTCREEWVDYYGDEEHQCVREDAHYGPCLCRCGHYVDGTYHVKGLI